MKTDAVEPVLPACRPATKCLLNKSVARISRSVAGLLLTALYLVVSGAQLYAQDFTVSTVAGSPGHSGSADGAALAGALFDSPQGIAVALDGTIYVADSANSTIRRIAPDGTVSVLAGSPGRTGTQNGTGTDARFSNPTGLLLDPSGNLLVADTFNHSIRKVTTNGVVTTLAGKSGSSGSNDGTNSIARFNDPSALAMDPAGNVYVADSANNCIRAISPDGMVSTIAGKAGLAGSTDGPKTSARFNFPSGIAYTGGMIWVADTLNHTIRSIDSHGLVKTMSGQAGVAGTTDGKGTVAKFNHPHGLAVDSLGTVFIGDEGNNTIRSIGTNGAIATVAGMPANKGTNDGPSLGARFFGPSGLAIDTADSIFIADTGNSTVRRAALVHPHPTRIEKLSGDLAFGLVYLGATLSKPFFIGNSGNSPLKVTNIVYPNGFSGVTNMTINAGASNRVDVTFKPGLVGTYTGIVTVQSDATSGTSTLPASGEGAVQPAPAMAFSGNLAFGAVVVGQSSQRTLTISNPGTAPLNVYLMQCPSGFSCDWSGRIPAGGSQDVVITFKPLLDGPFAGGLRVYADVFDGDPAMRVSGFGVLQERAELSVGGDLSFGSVFIGTSAQRTLTIDNDGDFPITVKRIVYPQGYSGSWSGEVPAGGRRSVVVDFFPKTEGSYSGVATVEIDSGTEMPSIGISGSGTRNDFDNGWRVQEIASHATITVRNETNGQSLNFNMPPNLVATPKGGICAIDWHYGVVRMLNPLGDASLVAGYPEVWVSRDGQWTNATFDFPHDAGFGPAGDLYLIDVGVIRKVSPNRVVTTLGRPTRNGVPFQFNYGIALEPSGTIIVGNEGGRIFRFDEQLRGNQIAWVGIPVLNLTRSPAGSLYGILPDDNSIWWLGQDGKSKYIGGHSQVGTTDGDSDHVMFNRPQAIAFDHEGNLFVADRFNREIRMISAVDSTSSTILGSWTNPTNSHAGTYGTNASFSSPYSVIVDGDDNLVISDYGRTNLVRAIRRDSPERILRSTVELTNLVVGLAEKTATELLLENTGNAPIIVRGISAPAGFEVAWSGEIAPQAKYSIPVVFKPSTAGVYGGYLEIDSNANSGNDRVLISRSAVVKPIRNLFGLRDPAFSGVTVGTEAHKVATFVNPGNASIRVFGIVLPPGYYGAWSGVVAPGETVQFDIVFRPTEVKSYGGSLIVNCDADYGSATYRLSGSGIAEIKPILTERIVGKPGFLALRWPTTTISGYILESSASLDSNSIWVPVVNGEGATNGQFGANLSLKTNQSFFRLRRP